MFFSDFTRRPIDESNPSGTNPNGLDDFDEIKRQINGLNKVTGRVSWKTVQTLSKEILRTKGKDFRCSWALLRNSDRKPSRPKLNNY